MPTPSSGGCHCCGRKLEEAENLKLQRLESVILIKVSPSERSTHNRRLTVEDIFGRGLLELGVPHEADAVRVVGSIVTVVVGG